MDPLEEGDPRQVGEFTLLGRLGAGGMGRVYLGRSPGGRLVAVKVVHDRYARDQQFRVRFAREVAAARRVSGFYTAEVVATDPQAALPWMATRYIDGPTLQEVVERGGPLPVRRVFEVAAGVAEALVAIHAVGVVHRDLKPANVVLGADGPHVIDFGIARASEATSVTGTGLVVGTPGFMSPEHVRGEPAESPSDVFSFGALVFFAATGRQVFGTGTPAALVYRVLQAAPDLTAMADSRLRDLVRSCLTTDPQRRPTATQILTVCARTVHGPRPGGPSTADWSTPEQLTAGPPPGRASGETTTVATAGAQTPPEAATLPSPAQAPTRLDAAPSAPGTGQSSRTGATRLAAQAGDPGSGRTGWRAGVLVAGAAAVVALVVTALAVGGDHLTTAATSTPTPARTTGGPYQVPSVASVTSLPRATSWAQPPSANLAEGRAWNWRLDTSYGAILVGLDGARAPRAVSSTIFLSRQGFYDSTPCYRLTTKDIYLLQCGDPTGTGSGGPGYSYGPVENAPQDHLYPAGTVAMARGKDGRSMGSQFFLVYRDSRIPGDAAGGYTVLGRITGGLAVLDKVAAGGAVGGFDGPPARTVSILSSTVTAR